MIPKEDPNAPLSKEMNDFLALNLSSAGRRVKRPGWRAAVIFNKATASDVTRLRCAAGARVLFALTEKINELRSD
jgi:hypothetical protein